ncbi:MAG: Multifunctional CCA protein [Parcubacteria group bacterium ADurb.Bin159]|jgi:poly(A) polymerase|nr:MAG: Multifunctional CCA protein [Parcubacteria group bacterium ADurb.Bin159]
MKNILKQSKIKDEEKDKFFLTNWQEKNQPLIQTFKFITSEYPQSRIYLVGGAVRDFILNRPTNDLDFIISGIEIEDLEKILEKFGKVNLVGKNFSVFKFAPQGLEGNSPVDIALPRKEYALGTGAYRDFAVEGDPYLPIEEDLGRRDFTINAIAFPIKFEKKRAGLKKDFLKDLIDPFKGKDDIKNKIIKAVGNPQKRFKEDYSRMLRAIRLACQLNFEIEINTFEAIKKQIKHLSDIRREAVLEKNNSLATPSIIEERIVPWEIIGQEFLKSFIANPLRAFDLYGESGAFKEIMPEILKMKGCPQPDNWHSEGDVWIHTRLCLFNLNSSAFKKQFKDPSLSPELILAVLLHDIGKPYTIQTPPLTDRIRFNEHDTEGGKIAEKILNRLKLYGFPNLSFEPKKVVWLISHHMLLVQGDISKMRQRTIEKYFFNSYYSGTDLLKLSFIDILSTVPQKGKQNFSDFYEMLQRIKGLQSLSRNKKELPSLLISGDEIMKKYNLPSGPKIGQLKELVREAQLRGEIKTKNDAYKLLDKKSKKDNIKK